MGMSPLMEKLNMPHAYRLLPLIFLLACPVSWAQTPTPPEPPQTLEQAAAQRERASQMQSDAEARYLAEQAKCYKKFLVNACLDDAKNERTQSVIDARALDLAARQFQREAKRTELDADDAKRSIEQTQREAEQTASAETFRANEAAKADERARKLAEKAQQAAAGRQKTAAEQAARQEKQARRAQQDAERAAKKRNEAPPAQPNDAQ